MFTSKVSVNVLIHSHLSPENGRARQRGRPRAARSSSQDAVPRRHHRTVHTTHLGQLSKDNNSGTQIVRQLPTSAMTANNCTHCSAFLMKQSKCCNQGKLVIDMLPESSPYLKYIRTAQNEEGVLFRPFIRQINNALAMASVGISEKVSSGNSSNPTVVIPRKAYFLMAPLQADARDSPTFAQLNVHEAGERNILDYRLAKIRSNNLAVQK